MSEEVLGIFLAVRPIGSGFFAKAWGCRLYFTTNRIIVEKAEELTRPFSRLSANKLGKLFSSTIQVSSDLTHFVSWNANARERLKMKEIFSVESLDNILKSDTENFVISYSDIRAVDVKKRMRYIIGVFIEDLDRPEYSFEIILEMRYGDDLMKLLETAMPGKI